MYEKLGINYIIYNCCDFEDKIFFKIVIIKGGGIGFNILGRDCYVLYIDGGVLLYL